MASVIDILRKSEFEALSNDKLEAKEMFDINTILEHIKKPGSSPPMDYTSVDKNTRCRIVSIR